MKQELKNYLKFGTFLFGITLIVLACEKENIDISGETYQEKRLKRISLETLNSRISNSPDYSNLSSLFDINKVSNSQNQQRLESTDETWLMTDEIVMIERDNATFYTFKVGTNTTGDEFYNLVVAMDETGTIVSMRVLQYIPNDSWLNDVSQPFVGGVKLIENTFFTTSDVTNTLSARGSSECVTGLDYEWVCNAGNNHAPNTCTAGGSEIIITPVYGPCPNEIDAGDSSTGGGFPVDTGSTGGGSTPDNDDGGSNDGDPPADGENCILDSDGNCLQDDTTPMPPRDINEDCLPDFSCRLGEIMDEDCDCRIDLEDPCANKDLRNYEVAIEAVNMLESRQQPNTMVQSSALVDSFILETIDDGWGDINQDRFSIKIDELPNGQTPFQLFNEIRMNFTNLVVGGDLAYATDVTLEPYSDQDGITWNSDNPVGAAMDFDTIFDTSTVYCVEYNEDEMYWIFATVTSYDHHGHFVAGVRQFGLEPNGSGGYSFYVRAADRLGGVADFTFNSVLNLVSDESLFTQAADATWKNLMENTASLIQNQGGIVEEFDETKTYGARHPYDEDDC